MTDFKWGDEGRAKTFDPDEERLKANLVKALEENVGHELTLDERLQAEELFNMAKQAGEAMSEIETEPENLCKFCGCPVDDGLEHEWRKSFTVAVPKELTSRMAHGFQRDKDGEWMHMNVWQCLLSWQWHNGALPLPDDLDN